MTRVVLLAGPSGGGKSRLAHVTGALPLRLDDFYLDADHPDLPRAHGIVDWDDPATWDASGAVAALTALVHEGRALVPSYSIAESRRVGMHELTLDGRGLVVAEGIFAIELLPHARAAGLQVEPVYLDRSRWLVGLLRLRRDLAQRRKPPLVLLRRGWALLRAQPGLKRRALAAGFRPMRMQTAVRLLGRA
ncbi:uridine kinase [Propioniciclava sp. MC1683]|uniref:uridine kinase n=1 Tax=Propioniciclava sp. MC1683 TaxID=2760309 RepID=UPI001602FEFD|nr:uridine kinase [Propioniciclava sp. MC1683]MBB1501423.1 uridine kinase [Propioniciclava sp. MC1683]NLE17358.1 uridine kinase [Propioniciclava sp.]